MRKHGGLAIVYGRRRVGKTTLLRRWLRGEEAACLTQAIEASPKIQLAHLCGELGRQFDFPAQPQSWTELFALMDRVPGRNIVVLDEFPYLVVCDPSLPSVIQRWFDHRQNRGLLVVLSGSSSTIMTNAALTAEAALFGRASVVLSVRPMKYASFCQALRVVPTRPDAFERFALTGGVPRYWEILRLHRCKDGVAAAEALFFGSNALLEGEPRRVLSDERIEGISAISVLEAIGRGAARPSEIAGRIGIAQTALSKTIELLTSIGLVARDTPFGISPRDSKKSNYRIADPCLRFWFSTYSPHRGRWATFSRPDKQALVSQHVGHVFEDVVREHFVGSSRYWEPNVEFDAVMATSSRELVVVEVKWRKLTAVERRSIVDDIARRFARCRLAKSYSLADIRVVDQSNLGELSTSVSKG